MPKKRPYTSDIPASDSQIDTSRSLARSWWRRGEVPVSYQGERRLRHNPNLWGRVFASRGDGPGRRYTGPVATPAAHDRPGVSRMGRLGRLSWAFTRRTGLRRCRAAPCAAAVRRPATARTRRRARASARRPPSAIPTAGCRRTLPLSGLTIVVPSARYWRTARTNLDQASQRAANSAASACLSMSRGSSLHSARPSVSSQPGGSGAARSNAGGVDAVAG